MSAMTTLGELHEINATVARMDQRMLDLTARFDAYLSAHGSEHGKIEERWAKHQVEALQRAQAVEHLEDCANRLRAVEDAILQIRTTTSIIKFTLGTSIIGAIGAVIAIVNAIAH